MKGPDTGIEAEYSDAYLAAIITYLAGFNLRVAEGEGKVKESRWISRGCVEEVASRIQRGEIEFGVERRPGGHLMVYAKKEEETD